MPGANCAFPGCGTSRKHEGVGNFKIPTRNDNFYNEWRKNLLDVLIKYRVVDKSFKKRIDDGKVYLCERHFIEQDMERTSKFHFVYKFRSINYENSVCCNCLYI